MRIAYIVNQYPKVSHSFIRREIHALERRGAQVFRIAIRGWDEAVVDERDISERKHTHYVLKDGAYPLVRALLYRLITRPIRLWEALKLAWSMSRKAERPFAVHLIYLAEACRILGWLQDANIGHVHAHFGTNSAGVAMLVHVLGGPKWSFTVHGPEEFDKTLLIGLAEKLRRCAFVVAVSSFGRSQLYRVMDPRNWSKVHVVRCGIDDVFAIAEPSSSAAQRLICVGRLCEQKGQVLLVEAVRRLVDKGLDFELILAGDGELREQVEDLVTRYKLADRIRITGWISSEQVKQEILDCRALILPSFAEGLPVVLMEAMALRRPVISTYIAGIPELVEDGQSGWLVPAGDIEALEQAIQTCLESSAKALTDMGEYARNSVLARHSIDREVAKLAQVFHDCAA